MNSLGRKVLVASLGVLIVLFGCYALLAVDLAKWNNASAHVMLDHRRALLDSQLHAALSRAVGESAAYALTGNRDYQRDALEALQQAHEAVDELQQVAVPVLTGAPSVTHEAFLDRQTHLLRMTEAGLQQAMAALATPGKAAGTAGAADTMGSIYDHLADADVLWTAIVAHHNVERIENEKWLRKQSQLAQAFLLAGALAILLALGLLVYYVRRHVVHPLTALARHTAMVAAGDLSRRTEVARGDEIGQLQRSFNGMVDDLEGQRVELSGLLERLARSRDAAQDANQAKTQFLANVSHEIRTPLHGVLVSLDLMHDTAADAAQRELAATARTSARSLLRMLNDLLDFSHIEAGDLALESVAFEACTVVKRAVELRLVRAADKGLTISCHVAENVPARLLGDPHRVGQLLVNLLDNAIKFTPRGSIDLSVSLAPPTDVVSASRQFGSARSTCLRFCVTDTGVGVPPHAAQKIFEPFYQAAHAVSHGQDGIGLGLGIARQLAASMSGELGFESELGKGSSFWFTVPLQLSGADDAAAPPPSAQPSPPRQFPAGGSVLLAEDHRDIREVMARTLQRRGLGVTTAENGSQAVALARQQAFDLILMDCRMPEMDGFEATRAIRALGGERAGVPIVALTAYGLTEPKQRYLDAGFDDLVVKPYTLEELEAALYRWLVLNRRAAGRPPPSEPELLSAHAFSDAAAAPRDN